ncbi:MAG: homoserine dehydrogenase [Flavobacteriales bacterium]|jgi:homoserine dehydrogenase
MKKIGLIGFGCVGQGLYLLLNSTGYEKAQIKSIAVKSKDKPRIAPAEILRYSAEELIDDPEIDIIIEAIDDADAALAIARKTIVAGKDFITANKKMVASNLEELTALAQLNNVVFRYESAVCGAIPIVQTIDNYFAYEPILSLRGIFNGTSNYILSKIFNEKLDYKVALKQAQDLGFAETDPTADVGGYDPKYKLIILALHAFGVYLATEDVLNFGIDSLNKEDIDFARERNLKIKLVPSIYQIDGKVFGYVLPEFVSDKDNLYQVENEFNGVNVEAGFAGAQFLYGRGAGSFPTAAAVASDLDHVVNKRGYFYQKKIKPSTVADDANILIEVYTRFTNEAIQKVLAFENVTEGLFTEDFRQLTGYVSLKQLKNVAHILKREKVSIIATGRRKLIGQKTTEKILEQEKRRA